MNYKELFTVSLEELGNLKMSRKELKDKWDDAPEGSEEEAELDAKIKSVDASIEETKKDLDFYVNKWLKSLDADVLTGVVSFENRATLLTLETLQSIIGGLGVQIRVRENRVLVLLESSKIASELLVNFVIEGNFLKSIAYITDCDAKDNAHKAEIKDICNAYNEKARIMKAYLDNDGTVMLERQDVISEGVTKETIEKIADLVIKSTFSFYRENYNIFTEIKKMNS